MSMDMNEVNLIGRLTKKVEVKNIKLKDGITEAPIVNFDLAVNDKKDRTAFVSCIALNKNAINIEKFTRIGSKIAITGSLSTTLVPLENGTKIKSTSVFVRKVIFLDYANNTDIVTNTDKEEDVPSTEVESAGVDIAPEYLSTMLSTLYDDEE